MKKLLDVVAVIGIILLVLAIIAISLALVLGVAIGIGRLIIIVLPFTLFEASLLSFFAAVIVGLLWYKILTSGPNLIGSSYDEEDDDDDDIPASRFYKTNADRTWEAWLRYRMANDIYLEFQDTPQPVAPMGEKQLQELAVRLVDVTIPLLKAKSSRVKQLKVTVAALKRQMDKIDQRPYDDHILRLAATAINEDLDYYHEEIINVIRLELWNKPYDII